MTSGRVSFTKLFGTTYAIISVNRSDNVTIKLRKSLRQLRRKKFYKTGPRTF
jgi:hypothetical protein